MRTAHVRPWDVGKDKVEEPAMTQEEWVEKRRNERKDEFAPMYNVQAPAKFDVTVPPPSMKKRKMNESLSTDDREDKAMGTSSEEAIEAGLRFIREQVEQQRSSSNY
ncbi:uncharacterized protein [Halyomorpha halys]|uniref:uncharacterized protein n=1 Tax=Halyomorpha halys TaxID=286706 RepID=UPI000D0C90BD|nr:uncharacterized protein LOC112211023 [Halyomorpha halys]XP_024217671.1 uncharacterized protein LOC112211023 [Halyomorpha halys]